MAGWGGSDGGFMNVVDIDAGKVGTTVEKAVPAAAAEPTGTKGTDTITRLDFFGAPTTSSSATATGGGADKAAQSASSASAPRPAGTQHRDRQHGGNAGNVPVRAGSGGSATSAAAAAGGGVLPKVAKDKDEQGRTARTGAEPAMRAPALMGADAPAVGANSAAAEFRHQPVAADPAAAAEKRASYQRAVTAPQTASPQTSVVVQHAKKRASYQAAVVPAQQTPAKDVSGGTPRAAVAAPAPERLDLFPQPTTESGSSNSSRSLTKMTGRQSGQNKQSANGSSTAGTRCKRCNAKLQFCMCNTERSGTAGRKPKPRSGNSPQAHDAVGRTAASASSALELNPAFSPAPAAPAAGGRLPVRSPPTLATTGSRAGSKGDAGAGSTVTVQRVDLFAASAALDVFNGPPVEFVPVSNKNDGTSSVAAADGAHDTGASAPMPAGFNLQEKKRQQAALPPRPKQTVGNKIGNWFGLGDPYGRMGPPKLAATQKSAGRKWLAQAKAAEKEARDAESAALEAALQTASTLAAIEETSFDTAGGGRKANNVLSSNPNPQRQRRGRAPPPPPARRIRAPRQLRKPHGVANTLRAARHKVASRVGVAKQHVSLEGKEGMSIKDPAEALAAYSAYIAAEKKFVRSEGYVTMKMNQKYTLRNRAAARTAAAPASGPGAMDTWKLAQSASMSTIKFSEEEALAENEEERLQEELMSLPEFTPYFTYSLTCVQAVVLLVMLGMSLIEPTSETGVSTEKFGKIGVSAKEVGCSLENMDCPFGFDGKVHLNATRIQPVNPWIGPSEEFLVRFNARVTTCMRTDTKIQASLALERERECGTTNTCETGDPDEGFSCCRNIATDNLGMMSKPACLEARGEWEQSTDGAGNKRNVKCSDVEGRLSLRPCCVGHKSECALLTETECAFADGIWHPTEELCSDVACLADVCGTWKKTMPNPKALNEVLEPSQGWRFIWPLFMHSGVIHYVLVAFPQWYLAKTIETTVGWLRIMLIYFISGVGGYMMSGLFDPYEITCGSDPALFGLLAVVLVELLVSWTVVEHPWWELLKQSALVALAFVLGTLPFIDNWGHLGGFVCGLFASVIFLPYVAFGKWAQRGRIIALVVSVPALLTLMMTLSFMFYRVANTDFCPNCYRFSCVNWHASMSCRAESSVSGSTLTTYISPAVDAPNNGGSIFAPTEDPGGG